MSQPGVFAQGDEVGEWVNLLVIIVMATFWIIGGLVKGVSESKKGQRQRQGAKKTPSRPVPERRDSRKTWLEQVARKAEELQRAAAERLQQIEQQAQGREPKRPPRPARPKPPKAAPPKPVVGPAAVTGGAEAMLPPKAQTSPESAARTLSDTIDFSDPDALKRAVLHYEILGKPLALRDAGDAPAGF